MTRKAMSIIGRIIGLIFVMALAFGITWCATHWPQVEAEWNKIFNKTPQDQPEEPTPEDPDGPYVHVHEYGEWKITFSPTCVEAGTETRTCACGYFEEREIAALGHTFGEWQTTTTPTCTTDGVKTKTCANCTESQTETLPATGHTFGEWTTTTEATYTESGLKTRSCINCTESQTESIPAILDGAYYSEDMNAYYVVENGTLGEAEGFVKEGVLYLVENGTYTISSIVEDGKLVGVEADFGGFKDATIIYDTESGLYYDGFGYIVFSNGKIEGDLSSLVVMPKSTEYEWHTHTFGENYVYSELSCTTDYIIAHDCDFCGVKKAVERTWRLGHDYVDGVCSRCGQTGAPCEQHENYYALYQPSTCEKDGFNCNYCKDCGVIFDSCVLKKRGHNYVDGICSRCGKDIQTCEHTNEKSEIVLAATCETEGSENILCSDCGVLLRTETLPATGHNFGEWETTTEATCASSGSMKRTCEICSVVETKSITKLSHTYEQDGSGVKIYHLRFSKGSTVFRKIYFDDGTTQTIMTTRTCNDCGMNVICPHRHMNLKHCMSCDKWETLESEKHVWETSLTQITKQPTCLETGTRTKTCHYCGYVLTEEIPALGHSFGDWETTTEATCTDAGTSTRTCANCSMQETQPLEALGHNYVDEVCSRCGAPTPAIISLDGDILTIENYNSSFHYSVCAQSDHAYGGVFVESRAVYDLTTIIIEDLFGPCGDPIYVFIETRTKDSEGHLGGVASDSEKVLYYIPHNYVDGVCSRCGEAETTIITPEIAINDNLLTINNFDGNGTVNLYYRELGADTWSSYVAGSVDTIDLTILLSRDLQPMERGKTYEIYVVFSYDNQQSSDSNIVEYAPECEHNFEKISCSTTCVSDGTEVEECSICGLKRTISIPAYGHNYVNGTCSRCGEADPNTVSEITLSISSLANEDFWLVFDVSSIKDYLLSEDPNNTSGFVFEVFLENATTHVGNKIVTQLLSLTDFNIRFGVDKMFASDYSRGDYNLSIVISSSTNFKIENISPVSFYHDGSHYLLTLSA